MMRRWTPAISGISGRLGQLLTLIQWLQFECLQKIAHATAVGLCGLDGFDPLLVAPILGRSKAWNMLVGAAPIEKPPAQNGVGHSILVSRSTAEGFDGLRRQVMDRQAAPGRVGMLRPAHHGFYEIAVVEIDLEWQLDEIGCGEIKAACDRSMS
jgi:hypothetical protein